MTSSRVCPASQLFSQVCHPDSAEFLKAMQIMGIDLHGLSSDKALGELPSLLHCIATKFCLNQTGRIEHSFPGFAALTSYPYSPEDVPHARVIAAENSKNVIFDPTVRLHRAYSAPSTPSTSVFLPQQQAVVDAFLSSLTPHTATLPTFFREDDQTPDRIRPTSLPRISQIDLPRPTILERRRSKNRNLPQKGIEAVEAVLPQIPWRTIRLPPRKDEAFSPPQWRKGPLLLPPEVQIPASPDCTSFSFEDNVWNPPSPRMTYPLPSADSREWNTNGVSYNGSTRSDATIVDAGPYFSTTANFTFQHYQTDAVSTDLKDYTFPKEESFDSEVDGRASKAGPVRRPLPDRVMNKPYARKERTASDDDVNSTEALN